MTDPEAEFVGVEAGEPEHDPVTADTGAVSGRPGQGTGPAPSGPPPPSVVADDALRTIAREIRTRHQYDGRLTRAMFAELDELLDVRTPREWKPPACAPGESLQWQVATMDAIFSRLHWTYRLFVQDGGTTGKGYVFIGNDITPDNVKIDRRTGELIIGDKAEILFSREGMGGVSHSTSKGTLLVATETHVMRKLLGRIGVGGDMFSGSSDLGAESDFQESGGYAPDLTAIAGIGDAKADELQVKDLAAIVRERHLLATQVADLICIAVGAPQKRWESEAAAQEFVDERLEDQQIVLPAAVVLPLKALLEAAAPGGGVALDTPATLGRRADTAPLPAAGSEVN